MTTRNGILSVYPALGGLDISNPTIIDPGSLVTADNIEYLSMGQRKKRLGMLQYSPTTSVQGTSTNVMVTSSSNVRGLKDTWDYTGSVPVQRLIAVTGASIFRSTGDGKWTAVSGTSSFGSNATLNCHITQADNKAIISDGAAQPIAYDLATTTLVSPTTGSIWPIFTGSVYHQERAWLWGLTTVGSTWAVHPSNVVVTAAANILDSTGADAVTLSIDRGDGDKVIGMSQPFYNNIYIFKGPNKGSVHQISGQTSTSYVKTKIATGAAAVNGRVVISTPTDIYWLSDYGCHSLATTIKFGDVDQALISLPIQNLWRKNLLSRSDLSNAVGFWNPHRNIVGWAVTPTSATSRYWVLVYNYALSDPSPGGRKFWSIWKFSRETAANFGITSIAHIRNPSGGFLSAKVGEDHIYWGTDRGMVYMGDYASFSDDGAQYPVTITTPIMSKFQTAAGVIPQTQEKTFTGVVTFYNASDGTAQGSCSMSVLVDGQNNSDAFLLAAPGDTLG